MPRGEGERSGAWWFSRSNGQGRDDGGAVDLDGDASSKKSDGEHEPSFVGLVLKEDAFDADERTGDDGDAIAATEVRVRHRRHPGINHPLDCFNLDGRDRRQTIPPVSEQANEAARLEHLDVALLVD